MGGLGRGREVDGEALHRRAHSSNGLSPPHGLLQRSVTHRLGGPFREDGVWYVSNAINATRQRLQVSASAFKSVGGSLCISSLSSLSILSVTTACAVVVRRRGTHTWRGCSACGCNPWSLCDSCICIALATTCGCGCGGGTMRLCESKNFGVRRVECWAAKHSAGGSHPPLSNANALSQSVRFGRHFSGMTLFRNHD